MTKLEVSNLVSSLNIKIPSKTVYRVFDELDNKHEGKLSFEQFYALMQKIRHRYVSTKIYLKRNYEPLYVLV